jgi:hypothetical protein
MLILSAFDHFGETRRSAALIPGASVTDGRLAWCPSGSLITKPRSTIVEIHLSPMVPPTPGREAQLRH